MNYHNLDGVNHGLWMNNVLERSESDVIAFFEPDCIPLNKKYLEYIEYVYNNKTLIGIAQVANHIHPKCHIYAGPGFYCISTEFYRKLGSPTFLATRRGDIAEEVCYRAEELGWRYRSLFPTFFEREPSEGLWPLGSIGYFGIGTVYDNAVYHLFQSRMAQNIELFCKRCDEVIKGTFSIEGFHSSTTFSYNGKTVR